MTAGLLRRIFGPKNQEVIAELRKLHTEGPGDSPPRHCGEQKGTVFVSSACCFILSEANLEHVDKL
jgi:hypothetical protein